MNISVRKHCIVDFYVASVITVHFLLCFLNWYNLEAENMKEGEPVDMIYILEIWPTNFTSDKKL